MAKHKVKLYTVALMSEVEIEANSEAEAIEKAEGIAKVGGCKFYSPDRSLISLVYREAPKRSRGRVSLEDSGGDDGA